VEVRESARHCGFSKSRQKSSFHGSADDPATQKKCVNLAGIAFVMRDANPHQPLIAKSIAHAKGKNAPSRASAHLGDLLFAIAPGCEIELIRFLREL
jgi:hypothetical protein